jgi:uncharacterized iron-regulated membrane protein
MTEVLFILTTIFVAYVIYVVVNEQKTSSNTPANKPAPEKPVASPKSVTPQKPVAVVKKAAPQAAPKNDQPVAAKPVAAVAKKPEVVAVSPDAGKRGLKDPKTGEVATAYSNYRFTKRWIKDALVAEGLLDKVYKNDELNTEIETRIKGAIVKLEAIAKYRA